MKKALLIVVAVLSIFLSQAWAVDAPDEGSQKASVAIIEMDMMILPGTQEFLQNSINRAVADGARVLIVRLDTPGGMLNTTQEMIQHMFASPIPIVIYVGPEGATATSAGVFITLAAHVAAMTPGTSIGAAHPVAGGGEDIEGDMRKKAENMTIAMVRSISEQRGRNVEWAEKAVKESDSITEKEALKNGVVDLVASDVSDLLRQLEGREVTLKSGVVKFENLRDLPRLEYEMSFKDKVINTLATPNIAALLWLGATTGLSIELYNPGLIFPGVFGAICLILALAVSQVIPISQGGLLLLLLGAALIAAELFVPSGILGIGGVIAIVLGSIYLIDVSQAPGMSVSYEVITPIAVFLAVLLFIVMYTIRKSFAEPVTTGSEGLVGARGKAVANITDSGRVFVNGAYWNARAKEGVIEKGAQIEVVSMDGLTVEVRKVSE